MPNWYENELRVVGEKAALAELLAFAGGGIPPAGGEEGGTSGCASPWRTGQWSRLDGDGQQFHELRFHVEPWGLRHRIVAVFFSAWGPPTELLLPLSRRWPGLLFEDVWREGIMAEAGLWIAYGGKVVAEAKGRYKAFRMTLGPFGDPFDEATLKAYGMPSWDGAPANALDAKAV